MAAEVDVLCGAGYGEITPERVQPQRLPGSALGQPGWQHRSGFAEAPFGELFPGLAP